jgi:hypothetical protein
MLRSLAAMAVVTALFAGTLVAGLHYMNALDPAMLKGPKEDHAGAGKKVVATLTVVTAKAGTKLPQTATMKAFRRGGHVLRFETSQRLAAARARTFEHAARSFREL